LHDGGRGAIVLPDGSLTGDGVKARIRQHLLESCNLHTIVRLPNSVFQPYASVATNLLFFTKGKPTKEIWYWEHQLMEGVKAYSKTKPIHKSEFQSLKDWWDQREESEQAWRVSFAELEKTGFSLDVKNPHIGEVERSYSSVELLGMLHDSFRKSDELLDRLKKEI
jgi:type I restriction enzyme M protein